MPARDLTAPLTFDLDSTIVEVHGRAKQGAAFGYITFDVRFSITARQDPPQGQGRDRQPR